jgi:hypothetical protein
LGEFALVKKAASQDALDLWILGGDEKCMAGGFLGLGVATGKVESPGFEFAGFRIIFIPPEGLGGGDEGAIISAGRPKRFCLGYWSYQEIAKKKKREKIHADVSA